jgi:exopolysaccharide biosynthesis polyprenyl glycosylphosphotransferase
MLSGPTVAQAGAEEVQLGVAAGSVVDGCSALIRLRRIRLATAALDALSLIGALVAVHSLVAPATGSSPSLLLPSSLAGAVLWVAVFRAFGLYGWNGLDRPAVWGEARGIVSATAVGVLSILIVSAWWGRPLVGSLTWFVAFALSFELLSRWLVRWWMRREKGRGRLALRTLFVGVDEGAHVLGRRLTAPDGWFVPVGYVTPNGASPMNGSPVVGHIADVEAAIRSNGAECVFVASTGVSSDDVLAISRACRRTGAELRLTANVSDIFTPRLSVQSADGVTTIAFKPAFLSQSHAALKRGFDLAFGSVALLLTLPFMAVMAVAIRLTSRGPSFFRQARVTRGDRVFTIYKFRTMVSDTERALEGTVIDLTQPFFKMEDDPRLTRVGRYLRLFSLDELPQLWNVVRGDMSLIGPRPLPADQVAANEEFLRPRHEVRAGLTGLWQISGRSELDSEEALQIDRFYIENWSLSLDFYVLLKTVATVVTRRGAY